MNFEDLQKAWQSKDAGSKVTINADVLFKEVRRNQRQFWATIFWRDAREVGVAYLLAFFFLFCGTNHDWTDCFQALVCFGVGTFMVLDRVFQRRKQPVSNDFLKACVESSLHQVSHQIWLLKNVFWWYLLPIAVAVAIGTVDTIRRSRLTGTSMMIGWSVYVVFGVLLFWGIYRLNQRAVRKNLKPRRCELETLLAGLE